MSRPYISFAEVKAKVPIPDTFEPLGLAGHFTEKHGVYVGQCPFPTHQHGPQPNNQQFKINERDGTWCFYCFGDCKRGGDVVEFVKSVEQLSDEHVRFWFAEHFDSRLSTTRGRKHEQPKESAESKDAPLKPLPFYLNLDVEAAKPYLYHRGVTNDTIERYGLGLCTKGMLAGYVAIPLYRPHATDKENPAAYLGRWPGADFDADADRPRYKLPPGFEASQVVYGLREALTTPKTAPLIVVEGPFKVYHLVQAGFPNTVSTLTSSLSEEQAAIVLGTSRPIVLLFDGDEAGQTGMRKAAGKLVTQTYVRVVKLEDGQEPDHLTPQQLDELLSFAKPA